jgi:tripartite-type tricarboxylate transporter receptor subunit TctC
MKKSIFFGLSLAATMLASSASYASADYPKQPIRLIVPYSAGGVTDLAGRALAEQMGHYLGQPVIVENKTGANGTMGAIQMVNTKPDGYTLSMVPIGIFRMPHITGASYDPAKDFTYISQVAGFNYYLTVSSKSPWTTLAEFVEHAKTNAGKVSYGSPGAFSSQHIAMVQLGNEAGLNWTHIPFKGEADALTAVMGQHVQAAVGASGAIPYINNGDMRALATLGDERSAALPNVPTLKESGYDIVHTSAFGIIGPKGMPANVVAKIDEAIEKSMKDPALVKRMDTLGITPLYLNHADYTKTAMKSVVEEEKTIKSLGDLSSQ